MRNLEPFLIKQRSTDNKAQFVLCETNVGGSNTESLINHLKSKHRIHVILESEGHKTIPEQEEIRSQIVKKEMSLFEATKKRSNNLKTLFHALSSVFPCLIMCVSMPCQVCFHALSSVFPCLVKCVSMPYQVSIKAKPEEPERAISATELFVAKFRNRLNDESEL